MANIALPFAATGGRRVPNAGELANGIPCGPLDDEMFNWLYWYLTGEIASLITAAGGTPVDNDLQQLAKSVRSQRMNYVAAGGSANALTATLSIVPASYAELLFTPIWIQTAFTNTAAATLNLNGLGVKSILRSDGSPLKPGDIPGLSFVPVLYDGTAFRALIAGGANSPLSTSQTYATPGTYTFTVPDGVFRILAQVWGSGGGGGGAGYSTSDAGASGGGGGGYVERYIPVVPGQAVPVVVATRGIGGGAGANGSAGASSSVAGFAAGGGGAGTGATNGFPVTSGSGGSATSGTFNIPGRYGTLACRIIGGSIGGFGGPSFMSSPAGPNLADGAEGVFPGGGGAGGTCGVPGSAQGGLGAHGLVVISY